MWSLFLWLAFSAFSGNESANSVYPSISSFGSFMGKQTQIARLMKLLKAELTSILSLCIVSFVMYPHLPHKTRHIPISPALCRHHRMLDASQGCESAESEGHNCQTTSQNTSASTTDESRTRKHWPAGRDSPPHQMHKISFPSTSQGSSPNPQFFIPGTVDRLRWLVLSALWPNHLLTACLDPNFKAAADVLTEISRH